MISTFVASYGYLAVFIGTLLEGETVLVAAGFAAHRGLLSWPDVVLTAIIGAILGDQLAFLLGRWKGHALLERFPKLARHQPRIHHLLERYDVAFILSIRFLYGLRIAGPILLGSSRLPALRFFVLNVVGAVLWTVAITGLGYFFGATLNLLIADMKRFETSILTAIVVIGVGLMIWHKRRTR